LRKTCNFRRFYHTSKVHTCQSFVQKIGEQEGACEFYLACEPIKRALKREALINRNLGHVICPYPEINLSRYMEVAKEQIKAKYPECLEESEQR